MIEAETDQQQNDTLQLEKKPSKLKPLAMPTPTTNPVQQSIASIIPSATTMDLLNLGIDSIQ